MYVELVDEGLSSCCRWFVEVEDEERVEEKIGEAAFDIRIDSASEELEYSGVSRRIIARDSRDDPEAGCRRDTMKRDSLKPK